MSNIEKSIAQLRVSVENLEASFQLFEENKATAKNDTEGEQPDMFPAGTGDAMNKRLDKAIKDVETLIEGA